jgi:hypothetical protein
MSPNVISIKSGRAKGYKGRTYVRTYGESGAVTAYPAGDEVMVTYRNGKTKVYRLKDGIFLRTI